MSNILNRAQKIKSEQDRKDQEQDDVNRKAHLERVSILESLEKNLMDELKKIDGQPFKHGKFRLEIPEQGGGTCNPIAYLWADYDKKLCKVSGKVAWFKAAIISGTYDLSDDCRDISYTTPSMWARFYPPNCNNNHDGTWDVQESRYYHNGGWTESLSGKDFEKFFGKMAEKLAQWF